MNCQEISLILDTRDVRRLAAAERQAVEAHLHGCAECANDWQAHQRVLGSRVPEMASDLPGRVWAFVQAPASGRMAGVPVRRSLVWGGLLFVGAAAAMIGWLSLREAGPESASMAIPVAIESDAGMTATTTQEVVLPVQPEVPATGSQSSDGPAVAVSPPRHRLVVLPPRHENPDPAAVEFLNAVHHAILGDLRSKADLEIVEASARAVEVAEADVPPSPPPPSPPPLTPPLPPGLARYGAGLPPASVNNDLERDLAIARHLGGEYTLHVSLTVTPGFWSIDTRHRGPQFSGNHSFMNPILQADDPRFLDGARYLGARIARQVYVDLFPDSGLSQYLSVLTDPRETETRRLDALGEALGSVIMQHNEASTGSADAVLQGAIELAHSSEPETRRRVWELLRRTANPAALEALRLALLSDPEVEVRREAANSLFDSVNDPAVRAAFESAAASDPSDVIRLLAKLALVPGSERAAFVIATLHDRSLTPEARMAPLMIARRRPSYATGLSLDERALAAIAEIAEQSSDPAVKARARAELARASNAR